MALKLAGLIAFFSVFLFISQTLCQIPPDVQLQVDNVIAEFMQFHNVPAMGLSIVKNNGEILYTTGYGYSDVEEGLASDDATTFAIGSISKVRQLYI